MVVRVCAQRRERKKRVRREERGKEGLIIHMIKACDIYVKRDLRYQKRPTNETCKRDLQKRPTKETYKRDLQKRPTKETYKRDLQKRLMREGLYT